MNLAYFIFSSIIWVSPYLLSMDFTGTIYILEVYVLDYFAESVP